MTVKGTGKYGDNCFRMMPSRRTSTLSPILRDFFLAQVLRVIIGHTASFATFSVDRVRVLQNHLAAIDIRSLGVACAWVDRTTMWQGGGPSCYVGGLHGSFLRACIALVSMILIRFEHINSIHLLQRLHEAFYFAIGLRPSRSDFGAV